MTFDLSFLGSELTLAAFSFLGSELTLAAVSLVILVYLFHKFIIGVPK